MMHTTVWQWIRHGCKLEGGRTIDPDLVEIFLQQGVAQIRDQMGAGAFEASKFNDATKLMTRMLLVIFLSVYIMCYFS